MNIAKIVEGIFEGVIPATLVSTEHLKYDDCLDKYVFYVDAAAQAEKYNLDKEQWYMLTIVRNWNDGVYRDTAEVFPVAKREIVTTEWVRI